MSKKGGRNFTLYCFNKIWLEKQILILRNMKKRVSLQ